MGIIDFSIPKDIVQKIFQHKTIDNFIETGTYKGDSSFWAADFFKNVYTIEIDQEISKLTSERKDCPENIKFIVGDSREILAEVVKELRGNSFFWLDGHWCSGAGGKNNECPVLDEIRAIREISDPIIFIDDARCFLGPLPFPHKASDWPTIDEIFALLKHTFPHNLTTIQDDVIMCVPPEIKEILDKDWQEKYYSRFSPPESNKSHSVLFKAFNYLKKRVL
jgi:hypothetical protein